MNNIINCKKCNLEYMQEESHTCLKDISKFLFCTDGTFFPDGKKWYKFSPTEFQQRNKTPDDETKSIFSIV
jgi:hypothetical protein